MKVLLVNPNYYEHIFSNSLMKSAINRGTPSLAIALLGATLKNLRHNVACLDMNINNYSKNDLLRYTQNIKPDIICFTMTTPLFSIVKSYCKALRESGFEGSLVAGGPHPSALPQKTLENTLLDNIIVGEGDILLPKLIDGSRNLKNIWSKTNIQIIEGSDKLEEDLVLDNCPMPLYNKEDIPKYTQPAVTVRKNPVAHLETSRGCYGKCTFCNKKIHGFQYRSKSYMRVVNEIEYLISLGFKEIHIIDDGFTINKERVKKICDEILRRNLNVSWYPRGGVRVDCADLEMFKIMKKAGCYKIPFGIESGSQRILNEIKKGITLDQAKTALKYAKEAKLETECYFMFGLPTETAQDIQTSFNFAKKLSPDYVKFAISIPLPGTELFNYFRQKGLILTEDWELYHFASSPDKLYQHDVLPSDDIYRFYKKLNKKYYFRLSYIFKHIFTTIRRKSFCSDFKSFLSLLKS